MWRKRKTEVTTSANGQYAGLRGTFSIRGVRAEGLGICIRRNKEHISCSLRRDRGITPASTSKLSFGDERNAPRAIRRPSFWMGSRRRRYLGDV
jgi:hypothetical protein